MKRGHRLISIDGFPQDIASRLALLSISTAEEFLALREIDPESLSEVVSSSDQLLDRAVQLAQSAAGSTFLESLKSLPSELNYAHGALKPTSEDFDRYRPSGGDQRVHQERRSAQHDDDAE